MKVKIDVFYLVFSLLMIVLGCNQEEKRTDIVIVDFEQCLNKEQIVSISEIADTIEYIELKTPKDIIVTRISDVLKVDDYWIVRSLAGICKFSEDGMFIQSIGRKGQGPGEYLGIRGIDYDPKRKEVLVADAKQILFYDLEGNYIRNVKITEDFFYNVGISDTVLWTTALGIHQEKYLIHAFNEKRDTLCAVPNPNYGTQVKNTDGVYFVHSRHEKEFYRYKANLYLKNRASNDTVFRLSSSDMYPHIVFDMGKYKLPIQYEAWFSNTDYEKHASAYWGIPNVIEDDRFLFLSCQRRNGVSNNPYETSEDDWRYMIYDKESGFGFVAKEQLQDDIHGGPSVWPRFSTEEYYVGTVEWYELYPDVKAGKYSLSPELKRQFDSFNYGTNELLIIGKKRTNKKK
ncbi:6-bladed beta-propeller [Bacteroides sp.]|uniref:6-bladed beta-propeller n=1 Tax=Bacteroides sp. TaxID=29523 RepID=UPI0026119B58|nr:6-bladed beta-propeller [Bacteroides sp.]MDD3040939.1 6-bladed beta-propeller [Bacteroides sp.]